MVDPRLAYLFYIRHITCQLLSSVEDLCILNHQFAQRLTTQFPGIEISNMQVLAVFAALSTLIALVGVGLITGIVLERLLRFNKRLELQ
jgi:hypothetical protein